MNHEGLGHCRAVSRRSRTCLATLILARLLTGALGLNQCSGAELALETLHKFSSTDGGPRLPKEIVQGRDGSFYGTSTVGGSNGVGTIFRMTSAGEVTTLISFGGALGSVPQDGLIEGGDGNFYGMTYQDSNG